MARYHNPRVLLVSMPWMSPTAPSLALATLPALLAGAGIECDTLYGSLLFPRTESPQALLELFGAFMFTPHLYPGTDVDALVAHVAQQQIEAVAVNRLFSDDPEALAAKIGLTREVAEARMHAGIRDAGVALDRCFERVRAGDHDVIGFSVTFESQLPASLALARRIKAERPDVKIMFGGAACAEEQAEGLVASFDVVDVACSTEGEHVIVPLVRALVAGTPLADVPGIVFRNAAGALQHTPAPPLVQDLDQLPVPRYDDYLAEHARSEWRDYPARVFFETSRGCWWGQKHLCTFCGLNAEGLKFRAKSAERAYDEIEQLYRTYPQARQLSATDNILELDYYDTLLPRLARMERTPGHPLRIFFEIKSNVKPRQVALLGAAGILWVQPGIESFDDEILQLMDKGTTALRQVQFLKWAYQERVLPSYNIIVRNPGEQAEAYRRMRVLLPFISHLPPPAGVTPMLLERFSPYFERSEEFGIVDKRPRASYRFLYPDPRVDLDRLAYQFDYDHPMLHDRELQAVVREVATEIFRWQRTWQPGRAFYEDHGDHLVLHDRRGAVPLEHRLSGGAADLFRALDSVRSIEKIASEVPACTGDEARALIAEWHARKWIAIVGRQVVSVLPLERPRPLTIDEILALEPAKPRSSARPRLPVVA